MNQPQSPESLAQKSESLENLVTKGLARRQLLQGGLGGLLAASIPACKGLRDQRVDGMSDALPNNQTPARKPVFIGFQSVPAVTDQNFDHVIVPPGYSYRTFYAWGDPVVSGAPEWLSDASQSALEQAMQAGQSHDGMHFFSLPQAPNRALLVMNHEDAEPQFLHPNGPQRDAQGLRPREEVAKEQAAMGVSIIEMEYRPVQGWQKLRDSAYARRFTAQSPMLMSGPVKAHAHVRTVADPEGTLILGTINNCASSRTPWGTYLTCEENFYNYFVNKDEFDRSKRPEHARYGVAATSNFGWETADPRFDATPNKDQLHQGYVNEPNRFGWVVEIDPFDPNSTPKKRSALGRFAHENCEPALAPNGHLAFYMGDDARGEYIYKFVPKLSYKPGSESAPQDILDEGALFVAIMHDDGRGEWKELTYGRNGLTKMNGFADQADILIRARSAADHVGATPMDRPEWVAVHPEHRDVYIALTNNSKRGNGEARHELNAANPRPNNVYGHIIRIKETDNDPWASTFSWDIFVSAGDPQSEKPSAKGDIQGDAFGSPDGLWFDPQGRLWILTDYDDSSADYKNLGMNQMLCADPETRLIRRFLVGPKGCEITGITCSPDQKSLFVNIQHPTLSFPASDGQTRPRSCTLLITRDDGGLIGS